MVSTLVEADANVSMSSSSCAKRKDIMKSDTFQRCDSRTMTACNCHLVPSLSFKNWEPTTQDSPETSAAFKEQDKKEHKKEPSSRTSIENIMVPNLDSSKCFLFSPRLINELDAAAIKLQKVYKSYRTRRNLADCAVVVEELWWKALDFASLKHSSISFFTNGKQETAASRWARARTRAAKVGKGLSKDSKAQKLALQHWLEAIDPRHRYGHNLNLYYDVWFKTESTEPFFYWLDIGDGKEMNLENCPRIKLQQQCIKYLGPKERQAYRVIVENGKLVYKHSGTFVNSTDGAKWIFVLSTSRKFYVGQKIKGSFQHSSFLAGGATTASGRLVVKEGILKVIWPYSGHYLPTEENFKEFINFLQENNVDLTDVKRCTIDEDDECSPVNSPANEVSSEMDEVKPGTELETGDSIETEAEEASAESCRAHETSMEPAFELVGRGSHPPRKWTTGLGPRISCVRDYPTELQFMALEQVKLSPRINPSSAGNMGPIPSPRPSPAMRLSPRLAQMIPYPHLSLTLPSLEQKNRP